jgi:hypothetical protein
MEEYEDLRHINQINEDGSVVRRYQSPHFYFLGELGIVWYNPGGRVP